MKFITTFSFAIALSSLSTAFAGGGGSTRSDYCGYQLAQPHRICGKAGSTQVLFHHGSLYRYAETRRACPNGGDRIEGYTVTANNPNYLATDVYTLPSGEPVKENGLLEILAFDDQGDRLQVTYKVLAQWHADFGKTLSFDLSCSN